MPWLHRLLAGAVLAAPVLAGQVQANGLARTPDELLARMDADADGRVSLVEYQHYLSRGFRAMDANGDGIVDAHELPAGASARGQRRSIDLTAHEQRLARTFHRQDADADGALDARELAAPPR